MTKEIGMTNDQTIDGEQEPSSAQPPRVSETLLMRRIDAWTAQRVLCTSLGRAQFAIDYAQRRPTSRVVCNFFDLYSADEARRACDDVSNKPIITCKADLPAGEFDLAVIPCTRDGDSELTRELLQSAYERLTIGGSLLVATDNGRDSWLREEMEKLFARVDCAMCGEGVVYEGLKKTPLKRRRNFECEFAFRDGERLLRVASRPGVFSHRKLDLGARAMSEAMEIQPGERVFDIGCGWGALSLIAATRAEGTSVYAVDSSPRAVACTRKNAELNGLTNIVAELNADGACDSPGTYDVALANPPYYSRNRLSEIFLHGAHEALRPGGRVYVVTKHPAWYEATMPHRFDDISVVEHRGYHIFTGYKGQ